jgi:uncharacterized protein (UPF0303 family)
VKIPRAYGMNGLGKYHRDKTKQNKLPCFIDIVFSSKKKFLFCKIKILKKWKQQKKSKLPCFMDIVFSSKFSFLAKSKF